MGKGCVRRQWARGGGTHNLAPSLQILAALPMDWRGPHLLACSCLRVVFIPLFILCVYPSGTPTLRHPAWPCVFSLLMGISNGYFGSVPMILAAGKVGPKQRELAGEAPLGQADVGLPGRDTGPQNPRPRCQHSGGSRGQVHPGSSWVWGHPSATHSFICSTTAW